MVPYLLVDCIDLDAGMLGYIQVVEIRAVVGNQAVATDILDSEGTGPVRKIADLDLKKK